MDVPKGEDGAFSLEKLIKRLFGLYWQDLWSGSCVTVSNCCITAQLQTAFKLELFFKCGTSGVPRAQISENIEESQGCLSYYLVFLYQCLMCGLPPSFEVIKLVRFKKLYTSHQ